MAVAFVVRTCKRDPPIILMIARQRYIIIAGARCSHRRASNHKLPNVDFQRLSVDFSSLLISRMLTCAHYIVKHI